MFASWITRSSHNAEFATQSGYLPVTNDGMSALLANTDTVENEKYRMLYDAVSGMVDSYTFCALPRYEGAADVQSAFEKNVKRVLNAAHEDYVRRLEAGENAAVLMDELESRALAELRSLMQ